MKINSIIIQNIKAILLGIFVVIGSSYVFAGYSAPGCAPTGCNSDAPINIGQGPQYKTGRLVVGTFDMSSLSQYIFSVKNALSYIQSLATNNLTLIDGTQADGLVLTSVDDTGLATWRSLSSSTPPTKIYVDDFRLYVKRNAGTVTVSIPQNYQYCAISQLGPDYANSDKPQSECSVNRNADRTWTLKGQRGDDPGFWCNVRCFSIETKPIIVNTGTGAPIAKVYYCNHTFVPNVGNSQWDATYFGCATVNSFDPRTAEYNDVYTRNDSTSTGSGNYTADVANFEVNQRRSYANLACGVGNWAINPVGANENLASTGFKCN